MRFFVYFWGLFFGCIFLSIFVSMFCHLVQWDTTMMGRWLQCCNTQRLCWGDKKLWFQWLSQDGMCCHCSAVMPHDLGVHILWQHNNWRSVGATTHDFDKLIFFNFQAPFCSAPRMRIFYTSDGLNAAISLPIRAGSSEMSPTLNFVVLWKLKITQNVKIFMSYHR